MTAAGAGRVEFRRWRDWREEGSKAAGAGWTVGDSLLTGAGVFVLFLIFRFWVLPLFPEPDGLLATATAAAVAGGIASWLVKLRRRS